MGRGSRGEPGRAGLLYGFPFSRAFAKFGHPAWSVLLLVLTVSCALGVVSSQHKARKLFAALQKEKDRSQQMEVEWGQLQLEQGTWAMPARIENIASAKLHMKLPDQGSVHRINLPALIGSEP